MNEHTRHGFIGIQLTRPLREDLSKVQRQLDRNGAKCVPTKHLQLTLDDLGELPEPAFEAARLAAERVIARYQPFSVTVKGVDAWPKASPRMVRALVDDPDGHLAELRADLHEALADYGFPVPDGRWRPHVLLARVDSAPGGLDARREFGQLRVRRVSLFRRGRRAFEPEWSAQMPRERPEPAATTTEDDIASELDSRVAAHLEQIQPTQRARRRNRGRAAIEALEATETATEPTEKEES